MTKASVVKSTEKASSQPVVPPVVVVVENVKPSKKEVKKTKKAAPEAVPEQSAAPVTVPVPVVPAVVAEPVTPVVPPIEVAELVTETSIVQKMVEFNSQLINLASLIQSLKSQYKTLEKSVNKELKTYSKVSNKKNKRSGNRPPSGFVRPTKISDELATFLGKTSGVEMARTEVSKEIIKYIREHDLQNKSNGRQINADTKLSNLLKLKEGDVLTYFNLQRYMKHHFVKKEKAVVA